MQKIKRILVLILIAAFTLMQLPMTALASGAEESGQGSGIAVNEGDDRDDEGMGGVTDEGAGAATNEGSGGTAGEASGNGTDAGDGGVTGEASSNGTDAGGGAASVKSGEIVVFDMLPEEIRWQNTTTPVLPETVYGTVRGETPELSGTEIFENVRIPVTWQTEQGYNENAPERGLYVFNALPGGNYTLADGVELPRITVFTPETVSRFALFRMGGSGIDTSPLEITTAAQLAEIAELANAGRLESFLFNDSTVTVYLMLMNDLDLSGHGKSWNGGKGWKPIGTAENPFKGNFNGDGKTIAGLYISDNALDYAGLFGYVLDGVVEDIGLESVAITAKGFVGGVVGYINGSEGIIQNCYSYGRVSGITCIGGIAGYANTNSTVQHCYSTSMVNGGDVVGGVIGRVSEGRVQNCAALNPGVTGGNYVHRAIGFAYGEPSSLTMSGNAAYAGMTGGGIDRSDDGKDGADISATTIKGDGTIGGRFTEDNGWTVEDGKLPGFGQAIEMPGFIVDSTIDTNFSGEGTQESPHLISTAAQLAGLATLVNAGNSDYNDKYYKLTSDISLTQYGEDWNEGKGWVPIGTEANGFYGYFDGGSNTIAGLYINDTALVNAGLFGDTTGYIHDLKLKEIQITAKERVGGTAGAISFNSGKIERCSVNGIIAGQYDVGGVAGFISGMVSHCFSTCDVTGEWQVGGVVGQASNSPSGVQNCYATGTIIGTQGNIGGIVGKAASSPVLNCAALNSRVSALYSSVGRVVGDSGGLSDNVAFSGMIVNESTVTGVAGDHKNGVDISLVAIKEDGSVGNRFTEDNGWTVEKGKLPGFGVAVELPAHITDSLTSPFAGGDGSEGAPYQISTADQLAKLAELVNSDDETTRNEYNSKHYKLMSHIDLSNYGENWNDGKGWIPIGNLRDNCFLGHFDGDYKTITGLYINDSGLEYAGLFGSMYGYSIEGTIKNLGLVEVCIAGGKKTGGVLGDAYTVALSGQGVCIKNCYVTGSVTGTSSAGGITGEFSAEGGEIASCYTSGSIICSVSGTGAVGGIAGRFSMGSIIGCYTTGQVSGYFVGGIVGFIANSGLSMTNCSALCPSVTGSGNYSGRVVGSIQDGTFQANYAFSGMKVNGTVVSNGAATDKNGADISANQIYDASFWMDAGNWDGTGWDNSNWTIVNGKLPILAGFAADTQSGDGGLYLIERDIANATIGAIGNLTYNGNEQIPNLSVSFDGTALVKDKDYTIHITSTDGSGTSAGINVGNVAVKLVGIGNFKGEKTGVAYTIQPKALAGNMLTPPVGPFIYTGTAQTPVVTVIDGSTTLNVDENYTVSYGSNVDAGIATVKVTGKGNYTGDIWGGFTIQKAPLTIIGGTVTAKTYDGSRTANITALEFDGLKNGEKLAIISNYFINNPLFDTADAGSNKTVTATVILSPGTSMNPSPARNYELTNPNPTLTGKVIEKAPAPSISWPTPSSVNYGSPLSESTLSDSSSFGSFAWDDSTVIPTVANAGYKVNFTPYEATVNNYDAISVTTEMVYISVVPKSVSELAVAPVTPVVYNGSPHRPDVTVKDGSTTLKLDEDYIAEYENNTDAGTATIHLTCKGNYSGNRQIDFTIEKAVPAALIWPTAASISYGVPLAASSLTGGSTNGTWAWTNAMGTFPPVGTAGYEVGFTPSDTRNYDWSSVTLQQNISLTVNKSSDLSVSTQPSMYVKEGLARSYTFNMDGIELSKTDTGTKSYTATEEMDVNGILSNITVDGSTLSYDVANTAAEGNTATIKIKITSANYVDTEARLNITAIARSTACDVVSLSSPAGSTISGTNISAAVANSSSSQLVSATVSADATWALYSDIDCTNEIRNKTMPLSVGVNKVYIKVTAEDTVTTKVYTVVITRSGSTGGGSSGTSAPTETYRIEVSLSDNTAIATTTVIARLGSSGSATAEINRSQASDAIDKALEEAKKQGDGTKSRVEIKVEAPVEAVSTETSIPKGAVNQALEAGVGAFTISSPVASVTFDANTLSGFSEQAAGDIKITTSKVEGSTLSPEVQRTVGDRPVFDFRVTSGGNTISQFAGDVSVSVPYIPKEGEDTDSIVIYYINADGGLEPVRNCVYDPVTGRVSFSTRHFSRYAVGYNKVVFRDVAENAWYNKAVGFIAARQITEGTGNGNFSPEAKLTRGQFIVMLMRAYGISADENTKDNFADAGNTYYTDFLATAKRLGISAGVGNNTFEPNRDITRQEMFTLLHNTLKLIGRLPERTAGKSLSSYEDTASIASWAKEAMKCLVEAGTVNGSKDMLSPAGTTTRAEMAQVLYNLLSK